MFRKLLPRKDVFFQYLEDAAAKAVDIVDAFRELLDHLDEVEARVKAIRELEHDADNILHKVLGDLHRTFVTPLDRNEISRIAKRIDDIVDLVEGAAQRIYHYDLRTPREPIKTLVDLLAEQVRLVRKAMEGLSDLKHPGELRQALIDINTIENKADEILRTTIGKLFREEQDPRVIIKWKEVFEHLEKATDRCEDVADQVENVLLEYA